MISPSTVPIVEPVFRGLPPLREEVLSPAEAFERYEVPTPGELYAQPRGDAAADPAAVAG